MHACVALIVERESERGRALIAAAASLTTSAACIHVPGKKKKHNVGKRVGFIGAGKMAEALAMGFVNQDVVEAKHICCSDLSEERKDVFRKFGALAFSSNIEVGARGCPIVADLHLCVVQKAVRRSLLAMIFSSTGIAFNTPPCSPLCTAILSS